MHVSDTFPLSLEFYYQLINDESFRNYTRIARNALLWKLRNDWVLRERAYIVRLSEKGTE